jgi:hypothetical protein
MGDADSLATKARRCGTIWQAWEKRNLPNANYPEETPSATVMTPIHC